MKKTVIVFSLLVMSLGVFSQESHSVAKCKTSQEKKISANELKVNLPTTIFLSCPEISYERILDVDISVGASLAMGLDTDRYPMQFALMPYFRWFFGGRNKAMERAGSGFFIEANSALFSAKGGSLFGDYYIDNDTPAPKSTFGAGLGMGIGWKYLSHNNWIGDITYGGGRDFANNSFYLRWGISIGKRF